MKITHITTRPTNAEALQKMISEADFSTEQICIFEDKLNYGPLHQADVSFAQIRSGWQAAIQGKPLTELEDLTINDTQKLMELSTHFSNHEEDVLWFWMAPNAVDFCTYFWLLHYFKKHEGRVFVVNITGLPFLDDEGKLFYPDQVDQLPQKELIKARKLARCLTPSEWEVDGSEWQRLVLENAGIRLWEGGKKIKGLPENHYDETILQLCANGSIKINKLIQTAIQKQKVSLLAEQIQHRLRIMEGNGFLKIEKADVKSLLHNTSSSETETTETT